MRFIKSWLKNLLFVLMIWVGVAVCFTLLALVLWLSQQAFGPGFGSAVGAGIMAVILVTAFTLLKVMR